MNTQIERNKSNEHFLITGNWRLETRLLQEKFPVLTDEDVRLECGNEEDLLMRIGRKLSKERSEVIQIIQQLQT